MIPSSPRPHETPNNTISLFHLLFRQHDIHSSRVLSDPLNLACPGNRNDVRRKCTDPRQGELSCSDTLLSGEGGEVGDDVLVLFANLRQRISGVSNGGRGVKGTSPWNLGI